MQKRTMLSWSSGKDSAWTLHVLRQDPAIELAGLFTVINEKYDRASMHATRLALLRLQAEAAGLPLTIIALPDPCSMEQCNEVMGRFVAESAAGGIACMAFGDLFLEDIREYRVRQLAGTGVEPLFPLWCAAADTALLARRMLDAGLHAALTCVDPRQLPEPFVGRQYDAALLADLPSGVDPCGERGEFHTFCFGGPMFAFEIPVEVGDIVSRAGFWFADVVPRSLVHSLEGREGREGREGITLAPPPP